MSLALLQSAAPAVAESLPGADVPGLPAAPVDGGLDYLHLILHASIPVQLVLVLLVLASIASWVIIFRKRKVLGDASRDADDFEERFWSGGDLAALFRQVSGGEQRPNGLAAIFEAGFREFARLRQKRGMDSRTQIEGAQRAMRASLAREVDALESNLELLANVGSISPYVGLFGTVWGIMISFHGLASMKEATIATVAPGISEALIATAMGLFAAIPAVWAYNRFATKVDRISVRYEAFAEEFSSILQRQAPHDEY
ncbi:protein TolQ [Xanthomonadaceae bacterium JHOS43]|nr:protein TolQ [Xanthomonadaceae bacterium JHOS43]MCX7562813.1 protein TolQ [Xanthomonadaceae bacterium XH05]